MREIDSNKGDVELYKQYYSEANSKSNSELREDWEDNNYTDFSPSRGIGLSSDNRKNGRIIARYRAYLEVLKERDMLTQSWGAFNDYQIKYYLK